MDRGLVYRLMKMGLIGGNDWNLINSLLGSKTPKNPALVQLETELQNQARMKAPPLTQGYQHNYNLARPAVATQPQPTLPTQGYQHNYNLPRTKTASETLMDKYRSNPFFS